jgi:hypothetical protein
VAGDLSQCAGEFDARSTATNDHEREPGAPPVEIGRALRRLERIEDFVPDGGGLFDGLQTRGPFAPLVVAVISALRARGNDQRIVIASGAVEELDPARLRVDVDGFAEEDAGILLLTDDAADGGADVAGGKSPGCNLVEKRLE